MKVVCGRASQNLGSKIAQELGEEILPVEYKTFPDGEQYIKLDYETEEKTLVVQSITSDKDYVTLLFLLDALEKSETILAIPYFGYARQDKKFEEGEPISARVIAETIDREAEKVMTVDVHDEGIKKYFEAAKYKNLTAFQEISNHIVEKEEQHVVAPDYGAKSYARILGDELGCEYDYLEKKRKSEKDVETEYKSLDVKGKEVIVVDDVVSTGGTMSNAISLLKKEGASNIKIAVTHPVFAENSVQKLYSAGAEEIISTDTIEKSISNVSVSTIIAEEVARSIA